MAYKVYPVTKTAFECDDYRVKINGEEVALNAARVSAHPFNRRWPGHQRQIEQSEPISFLSMALDAPITLEVIPTKPAELGNLAIRPASAGLKHRVTENGSILIDLQKPQYFTVEAYGRSRALHVFADPMPRYEDVDLTDPNVLYFGAGVHEMGTIVLESDQTLFLDEGAVVYACVKAFDAHNVTIKGRGILDNSHNKEKVLFEANVESNDTAVRNVKRQHTVLLEYCTNVKIEGITIRDSLVYNIRPMACRGLDIRNVKIIGCWRYNSDGIDMHNCEDVVIEDCFIRTFDDSICVKGFDCYYEGDLEKAVWEAMHYNGGSYENFRNVRVRRCVIWNDWGKALEIGAETRAEEICDVVFEDCDVIHVTHGVLDVANVDYADVHDITYRNIRIELDDVIPKPTHQLNDQHVYELPTRDYAPPVICARAIYHYEYSAGGQRRGRNRDLLFEDIQVMGRHKPIFKFEGHSAEDTTRDVVIRNLTLNGKKIIDPEDYEMQIDEFCRNIVVE